METFKSLSEINPEIIDLGKRSDKNQVIIFLHIPKAGGTTINGIINQQYKKQLTFRFDGIENRHILAELGSDKRSKLKLIRGHFAFGLHEFLSCPATYFTLLRNPVSRTISHYNYLCRSSSVTNHERVKSMSLKEYILSDLSDNNLQTRMIFGLSKNHVSNDEEILTVAKHNLENKFSVVGLVERFDETLVLLRNAFNWRPPLYVQQNITPQQQALKNNIDDDIIDIIKQQNSLDMALYEYGQQKFEQQVDEFKNDFVQTLEMQKRMNKF
ncbi:sulfotransferase family 2 domain-containing protein [Sphaerospermopsis aphanizomenoides BCCUSP55]|uniref:sulfotransferase family 2 domain-containing protein n=1 Tax=Sphaerospermopsis aphanizomenoides TaxID=459663 RepID=UPI0019089CED|nr:sulfotransferase family 2 domain-containing protein [Sphaerospermopsis aphanizomenoides]MBK1987110.1 sulfotransferase family 2 domain-containing protein [Sphaerospermopsis aphanizomenoides BCCUSP55]